jgi:hypothetical protein
MRLSTFRCPSVDRHDAVSLLHPLATPQTFGFSKVIRSRNQDDEGEHYGRAGTKKAPYRVPNAGGEFAVALRTMTRAGMLRARQRWIKGRDIRRRESWKHPVRGTADASNILFEYTRAVGVWEGHSHRELPFRRLRIRPEWLVQRRFREDRRFACGAAEGGGSEGCTLLMEKEGVAGP